MIPAGSGYWILIGWLCVSMSMVLFFWSIEGEGKEENGNVSV
jgi:hypothetical protein